MFFRKYRARDFHILSMNSIIIFQRSFGTQRTLNGKFPQTGIVFICNGQMAALPDIAEPSTSSACLILPRNKTEQQQGMIFNKEELLTSRDFIFKTINAACFQMANYCHPTYHMYRTTNNHEAYNSY